METIHHSDVNCHTDVDLSPEQLGDLYEALLKPRLIEEKMLLLLRQGKVSKWFSGIGQEAVCVGATFALADTDYIFPLVRNLGAFTTRKLPLEKLFRQFFGKEGGFTKGRDRTFHFSTLDYRIIANPTLLVAQLPVALGITLAQRLKGEQAVALAFCGDGGTSEGDFHEALNVASVWQLPVLFLVENNQYALSTPNAEQFRCAQLADRAVGYGMEGLRIEGNCVLEMYQTVSRLTAEIRENPRPVLLECLTFRMRGHEEASGIKYVPQEMLDLWSKKDPIEKFEQFLEQKGILSLEARTKARELLKVEIDQAIEAALDADVVRSAVELELKDVFAPSSVQAKAPKSVATTEMRFVDAIRDGLQTALRTDSTTLLIGQDVAEYGGVFKVSDGLLAEFGKERIRNTPLCESAILGAGVGLALEGFHPIIEIQFADFISCGINQLYNNISKQHYRLGIPLPIIIRLPAGAGVGAGPYHSDSNEAWFMHVPGLKIAYPSTAADAKGMLLAAVEDRNPVLFFEHKLLYRSVSGSVPTDYYTVPLGQARLVQSGEDLTIVTYGAGVLWAEQVMSELPEVSINLLDLRSLCPLDTDAIVKAVEQTGRVLILHEARLTAGVGAEIAAIIASRCFSALDAPIERCANLDTPAPFAGNLEEIYLAKSRLKEAITKLLEY